MWAWLRTTASSDAGATGGAAQFRSLSSRSPWNRPHSSRTRAGAASKRNFEPVTVRAAPRKVRAGLTRLPSSEEVRGESPAGGSLGIARGAIADPDGNARSDFFGRAHGVGDRGLDGNFEGSGRALGARRSTATVRPARPTQPTNGPDRPQGGAPRAPEAQTAC